MSACEKCWADAGGNADAYGQLLLVRWNLHQVCTPEQQAGPDARKCPRCGRKTLHQHTGQPMCGCNPLRGHSSALTQSGESA